MNREMMKSKSWLAPAKINLCLHVVGKRPDGYHDLSMLMQCVALYDRVAVSLRSDGKITVDCPGLDLQPGVDNLAARAAHLLFDHVGIDTGAAISIDKQIPAAAGLGGGSSDAAAVLLLLDELLELHLPCHELMQLGQQLGADVPFFLFRKTAWATGVGEVLHPWPGLPPLWLVLVNPRIAVPTALVFQSLRLTHPRSEDKIPRFPVRIDEVVRLLHNDLEAVTCQLYPIVDEIKAKLLAAGAAGALMSGSGATVFGLFDSQYAADRAANALADGTGWWTVAVSTC